MPRTTDETSLDFTLARRLDLRRTAERERRRCQARLKRVLARLLVETKLQEAQAKVVSLEDAAAIGRLWTELGVTGWKRVFRIFGLSAPQEALEQVAALARRQLARLVEADGPAAVALADEIARVIEGSVARTGEGQEDPGDASPAAGSTRPLLAPVLDGRGKWG